MWKGINLLKSSRMIHFPFKVRSVGSTRMEISHEPMRIFRTDHVEFCIRISSKEKFAHDQINGIRYRTRFPHLIVKMPFAQHCYQMKEPRNAVDFSYTLENMENLRKLGLLPESPFTEFAMTPNLDLMLRQLPELMEHSQEYSIVDRIDLLCFHILEELFFIRKMSKTNEDPVEKKIRQIASFFQLHFMDEISMDEIAKRNGMSRCTFFRQWNRYFEDTPAQYLLKLKLQSAADTLLHSNSKVSCIAAALKFRNPAYFCEIFKKHFGATPLQYRHRKQ